ncbi:transporter substrate-binding domain-containing protein [uncultured Mailhella sp.]|uniref:ATP-binding protein n=1 Tax=uncultured Mailhella sp. TaxID=1981031 RepID=UPI0025CF75BE|nr:transporter substrate-binding domain-containing protein [uncultured Mailhella sp.]
MHRLSMLLFFFCLLCLPSRAVCSDIPDRRDALVIGVPPHSAPLSFLNEDRTGLLGLAVDLSVKMAEELGKNIVFVQSNARKLEQKLQRGEIDAMVGLLPVNLKNDFSDVLVTPLALNRAILVAGQEHQFTMESELAGRRVILQRGDAYIPKMLSMGCTVVQADSMTNALNRLVAGQADAYIASSVEMAFYIVQSKKYKDIRVMGGSLERIPMVMMVGRKSGLLERLTSALVHLEENGEVEKLRSRWLGRSLYVPGLWELYRYHILCAVAVLCCIFLASVTWIYALKRQVRKVSRRLIRSERKYRDLIEESPDIILLLDEEGRITLSNRAARKVLRIAGSGYSALLMEALCSETSGCLERFVQLIPRDGALRREITLASGTEQELVLEVNLFMADPESSPYAICLIGRDMTERRKLDRQVMEMERLAVLGKLAAGVAHEINNPIGIVMANAEIALEDCPEDSPIRPMLKAIHRNGERAVNTTRRLLNIALPSSVQYERQNLARIVREALFFLRPRLRTVKVDESLMPDDLPVRGNRVLLEQLVLNMLINALDSMEGAEEGRRFLLLEGRCADGRVTLAITDSGSGISEENRKKIFEPFFSTKGSKGFGLGLYISRHIMELHEGEIFVESELGEGSTLSLIFPAQAGEEASAD